jgi:hypothetical protein
MGEGVVCRCRKGVFDVEPVLVTALLRCWVQIQRLIVMRMVIYCCNRVYK